MFDLQIDKKKKKLSSMNKSCKKKQQNIVKIVYMWVFCKKKRKKYKTVCAELAFAKSPSTEWSWF